MFNAFATRCLSTHCVLAMILGLWHVFMKDSAPPTAPLRASQRRASSRYLANLCGVIASR